MQNEQELTLAEVLQAVRRNLLLLVATPILTALVVVAIALTKPKLYSYEGLVEIPQMGDLPLERTAGPTETGNNPSLYKIHLVDSDETVSFLKFKFLGKSVGQEGGYLNAIQIQDNGRMAANPLFESSMVVLTTLGPSLDAAKAELEAVVMALQHNYESKFKRSIDESHEHLKDIGDQITSLRGTLETIDKVEAKSRDSGASIALTMKRETLQNEIDKLIREKGWVSRMSPEANMNFRLVAEDAVSESPVSPKLDKSVILGIVAGCVLAFALFLVREALRKQRA
jgi:capsular polysaccharide biosynthesis protein